MQDKNNPDNNNQANKKQLIDIEKTKSFIQIPNLKKFPSLLSTDLVNLKQAIFKIKINQMISLAVDVQALLDIIGELPQDIMSKIFSIITMESVGFDKAKLTKIFDIKPSKESPEKNKTPDEDIKEELKALQKSDLYSYVYNFRHQYFLNKPQQLRDNIKASPLKISDTLLTMSTNSPYVSRFLVEKISELTEAEFKALKQAYSTENLNIKAFRREAHNDIALTTNEIQCFLLGAFSIMLQEGKVPSLYWPIEFTKANIFVSCHYTKSPHVEMIVENNIDKFKKHFAGEVGLIDYSTGMTLLCHAVKLGNKQFVEYFLKAGVDPNVTDYLGFTALHYAVEVGNNDILSLLLSTKLCKVNAEDNRGYTAIYLAAEKGDAFAVDLLLNAGADPNLANNRYQYTACHIAVRNNCYDVVDKLVASKKINTNLVDKARNTPAMLAKTRDDNIFVLLDKYENPFKSQTVMTSGGLPQVKILGQGIGSKVQNGAPLPNVAISSPQDVINLIRSGMPSQQVVQTLKNRGIALDQILKIIANAKNIIANNPQLKVQSGKLLTVPPVKMVPMTPVQNSQQQNPPQVTATSLKQLLQNPKDNKLFLTNIQKYASKIDNPFSVTQNEKKHVMSSVTTDFFANLRSEIEIPMDAKLSFKQYADEIKNINSEKLTFAQGYIKIVKIINCMRNEKYNFSFLAIAFELYKNDFLEHLISLQEQKSCLQIAIEVEESLAIKQILMEEPDRSHEVITHKDIKLSELKYAIQLGKVASVKTMIELKEQNDKIDFGPMPEDPVALAQDEFQKLSNMNQSFREADEHLAIDIPKCSKENEARIIKQLVNSIPNGATTLNGLYTEEEYNVVKVFVAQKDKPKSILTNTLKYFIAIDHLENRKEELLSKPETASKIVSPEEEIALISEKIEVLRSTKPFDNAFERAELYRAKEGEVRSEIIYKHATHNYDTIAKDKKLRTVDQAIRLANIRSATPIGTRKNIYFGIGGRLASITPLRKNNAANVIELKILEAIEKGIVKPTDIHTSPHVPAFKAERVERPIIFIGDDPSIKTILRIHHYHDHESGKYHKVYRYEYLKDDHLNDTHYEVYRMEDEYHVGDSVKLLTARFMRHLRNTKGDFEKGSYYHYVLQNYQNLDILDSAWAAFFNVLSIEGKISNDISIEHPAVLEGWTNGVRVVKNEEMNIKALDMGSVKNLENLILTNKLSEFTQYIQEKQIHKDQLANTLFFAIGINKYEFIASLLSSGVVVPQIALNMAMKNLTDVYLNHNRNVETEEFQVAFNILYMLFNFGTADDNDPTHIRYGNSSDNLGSTTWQNNSQEELLRIKKLLLQFEDTKLQLFLVSGICKHLKALYDFTFSLGLFDAHECIAKRLSARRQFVKDKEQETKEFYFPSLTENEMNKNLLNYANNNDYVRIVEFLKTQTPSDLEKYYFVLNCAIQSGKIDVVTACYPFFKNLENISSVYPPLHMALRHKQLEIALKLIELGADTNKKNLLGENSTEVAFSYGCIEIFDSIIEVKDTESSLIAAIRHEKYDFIPKLLERLDFKTVFTSEKGVVDVIEYLGPFITAIEKGNLNVVKLVMKKYLEIFSDKKDLLKKVMHVILISAQMKEKDEIFCEFVRQIVELKMHTLFTVKEKNVFSEILTTGSSRFIELCIQNLGSKTNFVLKTTDSENYNFLHLALKTGDLEKIEIIRKYAPTLDLINDKIDFFNVIKLFVETPNVDLIFDWIMEAGADFPSKMNDCIKILTEILFFGNYKIIAKILQFKILDPQIVTENGQNILHLIFNYLLDNTSNFEKQRYVSNGDKFKTNLEFLCNTYSLDVNHVDGNNKSLILMSSVPLPHCIKFFHGFLIGYKNTKFNVKDENDNTPLHLLHRNPDFKVLIDRYLQEGGDINAVNKNERTAFEEMLLGNSRPDFIEKMKSLNATASIYKNEKVMSLTVITCKNQNETYVLVRDKVTFLHQYFHEKIKPFKFISKEAETSNITFGHLDKNSRSTTKLPDPNKMIVGLGSNYEWIKMPHNFVKLDEDTFQTDVNGSVYQINVLNKELLEYISAKRPTLSGNKREGQYIVPHQILEQWQNEAKKLLDILESIYKPILTLNQTAVLDKDEINQKLNHVGFWFPIQVVGSDMSYESLFISSPLAAAVASGNLKMITSLIDQGYLPSFKDNWNSPFHLALTLKNQEVFELLLKTHKQLDSTAIMTCISVINVQYKQQNHQLLNILRCCLLTAGSIDMSKRHIRMIQNTINECLAGFQVNENNNFGTLKQEVEQLLANLKPAKGCGRKRKADSTEEKSDNEQKEEGHSSSEPSELSGPKNKKMKMDSPEEKSDAEQKGTRSKQSVSKNIDASFWGGNTRKRKSEEVGGKGKQVKRHDSEDSDSETPLKKA